MKFSFRKIALPALVLLTGLLAIKATGIQKASGSGNKQFSQKVNLALRETADRLFDLAGDSASLIPPVRMVSSNNYQLRLEHHFNYDSLPALLSEALTRFEIHEKYYVTVTDCLIGELKLGFASNHLPGSEAPCTGRELETGCYNLSVVFPNLPGAETIPPSPAWYGLLAISILALAISIFYKKRITEPLQTETAGSENHTLLRFGHSAFDPSNQSVLVDGVRQSLTFREAKLLHYFVQHTNQLLERDTILAAVWEDEGIIVGRSLDVFVSRLRKILQQDPTVKIANVHGVGYRFEVGS